MNKKNVNIYKTKEANVIKLREYLQKVGKTENNKNITDGIRKNI